MWLLSMVMLHVLIDDIPQMRFAEDKHFIETLMLYAPDETFCKRIQIRRSYGCLYTVVGNVTPDDVYFGPAGRDIETPGKIKKENNT